MFLWFQRQPVVIIINVFLFSLDHWMLLLLLLLLFLGAFVFSRLRTLITYVFLAVQLNLALK